MWVCFLFYHNIKHIVLKLKLKMATREKVILENCLIIFQNKHPLCISLYVLGILKCQEEALLMCKSAGHSQADKQMMLNHLCYHDYRHNPAVCFWKVGDKVTAGQLQWVTVVLFSLLYYAEMAPSGTLVEKIVLCLPFDIRLDALCLCQCVIFHSICIFLFKELTTVSMSKWKCCFSNVLGLI